MKKVKFPTYLMRFSFNLIMVTVFGVYMGQFLDNRKELSRLNAIAGILCGSVAALTDINQLWVADIMYIQLSIE